MELATFVIPEDEAKAKLDEYSRRVGFERTAEDRAIAMGYRAAARGLPVISLPRTIAAGGWFGNGLPRIAVAPATATECFVHWESWHRTGLIYADRDGWDVNRGALVGAHSVRAAIPADDRPPRRLESGRTLVPIIPPSCRPNPRNLRHCHVLWEVEEWTRVPPVDPALIRHIRGDLWAVLSVWNLTELERYVLSQR